MNGWQMMTRCFFLKGIFLPLNQQQQTCEQCRTRVATNQQQMAKTAQTLSTASFKFYQQGWRRIKPTLQQNLGCPGLPCDQESGGLLCHNCINQGGGREELHFNAGNVSTAAPKQIHWMLENKKYWWPMLHFGTKFQWKCSFTSEHDKLYP